MRRVSLLKNIGRFTKAASAIKRSAFRSRPENNRVGFLSATPRQRLIQQSFSKTLAPHFRNNIKVRHVSMKLQLVFNWIRKFLKQLHANVSEQPFAIVQNPAAPWARIRAKSFLHPRRASAHKSRFVLRCRSGFSTKLITQFSQRIRII